MVNELDNQIQETIIVIDFGAQYSQLIARRIRECNVYCEILPNTTSIDKLKEINSAGIILSGGPSNLYEQSALQIVPKIFELGVPVLGIDYGMQLMAFVLGGGVVPEGKKEHGKAEISLMPDSNLFNEMESAIIGWMSYGVTVKAVPPGFHISATTANNAIAAMSNNDRKLYAIQFHPEVAHTQNGEKIIDNFLFKICSCSGNWTMSSFIDNTVKNIKKQVGNGRVVCGLSGGVDSATVAALIHKAIGDQLTCIFVNNGLMRKNEPEMVQKTFRDTFHINLVYIDAEKRFLDRLAGITDPEQKRKIIGEEFIRVFEEESVKLGKVDFLAQGTIYPDVIESGTGTAATIKSHHNVGGLPKDMSFKLVEPLRQLFKDEVRLVCKELGFSDDITWRQPFPGPGLAVRVAGEVTKERLNILREADSIVQEEIKAAGLYKKLWQSFAILLPIRSVGMMGDQRTYAHPVILRVVNSEDAMTADWAKLPYELIERISSRIINEVQGINRVLYDVSSKPPATIEWE